MALTINKLQPWMG